MIVTVGGIKGGGGKTTAATNLTVMRRLAGCDVLLIDADEQRSASEFVAQREALGQGSLACVQLVGAAVRTQVRQLATRYSDIVIDTGGRDTASQRAALTVSDLLLVPFQPGNFDLWTLEQVERLVEEVRSVNEGLDAACFISRGYPVGADNAQAAEMLQKSTMLRFIATPIIGRKAFNTASGEGLSVVEAKPRDSKAVAEMQRLYQAVFGDDDAEAAALSQHDSGKVTA
ncbi:MAG: AAA family ATPase [Candidatus Hydrogenedens sp.]|nr:AAA family ATPase [Candidatus Hydrogenedens sp.]